jgi:hypothetical protein
MSSEGMQVGRVELVSMGRIVILFGLELEPGCSFRRIFRRAGRDALKWSVLRDGFRVG